MLGTAPTDLTRTTNVTVCTVSNREQRDMKWRYVRVVSGTNWQLQLWTCLDATAGTVQRKLLETALKLQTDIKFRPRDYDGWRGEGCVLL